MAWRAAKSLLTLKDQLDATYPGWLFFGFLGDQAHAAVASDHNPNAQGVVTALDIGPGGGLKIHDLAERLREKPHPDLKYIISNHRITLAEIGWAWGYYDGIDPHDTHIHISVGRGPDGQSTPPYDDTTKWNVKDEEDQDMMTRGGVFNAFYNLERRTPTEADYAAWTGQTYEKYLNERGYGAVKALYQKAFLGEGDVINVYYHLLKREPEPDALKFWQGHSGIELFYAIINSKEYIDKHK